MRKAAVVLALMVAGCGDGPATTALNAYNACLDARGVDGCRTEKAKLDAALSYADAQSRRMAAGALYRPAVYTPPPQPREPLTCTTIGITTTCQ